MKYKFGKVETEHLPSFFDDYDISNKIREGREEDHYIFSREVINLSKTITLSWEMESCYYGGAVTNSFETEEELLDFVKKTIPIKDFVEAKQYYSAALFYLQTLLKTPNFQLLPEITYTRKDRDSLEKGRLRYLINTPKLVEANKEEANRIKFLEEAEKGIVLKNKENIEYNKFNINHYQFDRIEITEEDIQLIRNLYFEYNDEDWDCAEEKSLFYNVSGSLLTGLKRPFGNSGIPSDIASNLSLWDKLSKEEQDDYKEIYKKEEDKDEDDEIDEDDLIYAWQDDNAEKILEYLYKVRRVLAVLLDRSHLGTEVGSYILKNGHWIKDE